MHRSQAMSYVDLEYLNSRHTRIYGTCFHVYSVLNDCPRNSTVHIQITDKLYNLNYLTSLQSLSSVLHHTFTPLLKSAHAVVCPFSPTISVGCCFGCCFE